MWLSSLPIAKASLLLFKAHVSLFYTKEQALIKVLYSYALLLVWTSQ